MKNIILLILTVFGSQLLTAQQEITLESIWKDYTFNAKRIPGFNFQNDGKHYSRLSDNKIVQFDLTTGEQTKVLFDGKKTHQSFPSFPKEFDSYSFSKDENQILLKTQTEAIYRRSSKANYFILFEESETPAPS